MKNLKKLALFAFLAAVLLFAMAFTAFAAEVAGGSCKDGGYSWSIDDAGTLTISGTGNGTLEFASPPDWDKLSRIPWYSQRDLVKKVVIEEETKITSIVNYGLSYLPNCKTVIIPTTLTDLSNWNIFAGMNNLDTIAVQGNDVIEGVIDLRGVTKFNTMLFSVSFNYTTPTIYLPANAESMNIGYWGGENWNGEIPACTELTVVTYPTSNTATLIRSIAAQQASSSASKDLPKKVTLKYYTLEQDSTLVRSGSQTTSGGHMDWSFDDATGTLTFTKGEGANPDWNEFLYNQNSTALKSWLGIWKDAIVHIDVASSFHKLQFNCWDGNPNSLFSNLINLQTVKFAQSEMEWQCSSPNGIFENCPKLTTLGFGETYTEGVIDLSPIVKFSASSHRSMFKGCKAITNVVFRSAAPTGKDPYRTQITDDFFNGCTSLSSITVPSWVTDICANAFAGCTALTEVILEGSPVIADKSAFPDNEGQALVIKASSKASEEAVNALGYTYTKAVFVDYDSFESAITMEGFAVRIKSYNGLRALFSFDNSKKASNEKCGFSLVEYGAICTSEANYSNYGVELTLNNGAYETPSKGVIKKPVFIGEERVGSILSTSSELSTDFAASVVKYTSNFKTNVYLCGYEIWEDAFGERVIIYTDCEDDSYDLTNIYQISLNLYKDGYVNSENDNEGIIWGVLESGVVTLNATTDYTYTEGQKDFNGTDIGGTFTFKDIPAVITWENTSAKQLVFTESNVKITLIEDGSNYIAFYRGTGELPGAEAWSNAGSNQLCNLFMGSYVAPSIPNPQLTWNTMYKIKTVIIDSGITTVNTGAFSKLHGLELFVYPSTLEKMTGQTFYQCVSLKAAYMTNTTAADYQPAKDVVDLSEIDYVAADYLFASCKAAQYVHMPANIGTNANGMLNTSTAIKALWCGDANKVDGVADFSNTSVEVFGDYAFQSATNLTTLKAPATVTAFYDVTGTTERHAFQGSGINKIITEIEVANISEYIATYGTTYGLTYEFGTAQ